MSDLWIILVLSGVAIVLGVVLFNWWQERKYRNRVEHHFKNTRRDVLIDDFEINADVLKHEKEMFLDTKSKQAVQSALDEATLRSGLSEEVEGWTSEPRKVSATKKQTPVADSHQTSNLSSSQETTGLNTKNKKEGTFNLFEHANPSADDATDALNNEITPSVSNETEEDLQDYSLLKSSEESLNPMPNSPFVSDDELETQKETMADHLPPHLHTQMDLIAVLHSKMGVSAEQLTPLIAEVATFEQNCFVLARAKEGGWVDLKAQKQTTTLFEQVVCSLQLADRSGAVDRALIFRFQHSIETLGVNLGLHVEWIGGNDALQQAQNIDQFCIEVDKAVEFHVVANQGAFHATKFRGLAEASGMILSEEGKYELRNSERQLNFCIRNYEGKPFSADMLKTAVMTGFTFQLDIPTVTHNTQVFDQMVSIAQSMASSLDATMIDVNRRPIGDIQLEKIRQQLKVINATMIAKGIIPGSSQALRLFS